MLVDTRPAVDAALLPPSRRRRFRRTVEGSARSWVFITVVGVLALLIIPPLAFLVWSSFTGGDGIISAGGATWSWYAEIFKSANSLTYLKNTVIYAVPSAFFGAAGGFLLAYLTESLRIRAVTAITYVGLFFGFAVPGIVRCIGWIFLLGSETSLIDRALGIHTAIESLWGMIFVESLFWMPIAYLLFRGPIRATNTELEEAARVSGATSRAVTLRVVLPLMRPALLSVGILLIIGSIQSFEVPLFLGIPAGYTTITAYIYDAIGAQDIPNYGAVCAYGVILLLVLSVILIYYLRMTRVASQFQTISGRGYRQRTKPMQGWQKAAAIVVVSIFVVVEAAPIVFILFSSFTKLGTGTSGWTFVNWSQIWGLQSITSSIENSLFCALISATVAVGIALGVAWLRVRTRMRGKSVLSFAASVPMILPAVVVGLGIRVLVIKAAFLHLYGTRWVFCLAYVPLIVPFTLRYVEPAMLQISSGLEEAAWCSGARWSQSSRRVLLPLLKTSVISAWLLGFLFAMRELGASVMLFTLSTQTIGVQLLQAFTNDSVGQTAAFSAFVGLIGLAVAGAAILLTRRFLWGHNDRVSEAEAPDEARGVEGPQ